MTNERMFPFITKTWNPLGGECLHKCPYCWVTKQLKPMFPNVRKKYSGEPRLVQYELENAKYKLWEINDYVFVCDCTDLFGNWVPTEYIRQILEVIGTRTNRFLLLTKNPERYRQLISIGVSIPDNCVLGCTIESDIDHLSTGMMESARLAVMLELSLMGYPVMLSIEPIMDFSLKFIEKIVEIKPRCVAVGYDNYSNGLTEPSLEKTKFLMERLAAIGITVYAKTIREAINRNKEMQHK